MLLSHAITIILITPINIYITYIQDESFNYDPSLTASPMDGETRMKKCVSQFLVSNYSTLVLYLLT